MGDIKKILVVDDNEELRANIVDVLKGAGYRAEEASSGREAIDRAGSEEFHVILLDLMLPGISGMDTLSVLKRISPRTKVIMITAFATIENAVDAMKRGASDYISKPIKVDALRSVIGRSIEEKRFEEGIKNIAVDNTISAISNPIRRKIIKILCEGREMRLMEITKELNIEDHTKTVFHLKLLKEAYLIEQDEKRAYLLTKEGKRIFEYLKILENYLRTHT